MAQSFSEELLNPGVQDQPKSFADELLNVGFGGAEAEIRPPVEVESSRFSPFTGRPLPPSRADELRARGIDIEAEQGGTIPQRLAGQFGTIQDVKNSLAEGTEFSPEDFQVANDPKLGIMFKGPQDEAFRSLDPARLETGDIAPTALELVPTAAEIGTGLVTKNPAIIAAAGAEARGAVLAVLKKFDIIEDPDIIQEALIEGGLSLAGGTAPIIKRALSAERRAIQSVAPRATGEQFEQGARQLTEVAEDVEQATGVRPKFTVGEELSAVEPEFAAPVIGAEEASGAALVTQRTQRQATEALQETLERGALPGEQLAQDIVERQAGRVAQVTQKAEDVAESQIKKITAELDQISGTTSPKEIRAVLTKGTEDVRTSISRSYDQIRADAAEANIDLSGVGTVAEEIIEKARVFPNANTVFKEALEASTKPGGGLNTYQAAQEARSELRAHIRRLKLDKSAGAQVREAQILEKEFSAAINNALSEIDPTLAQRLIDTDIAFKSAKEKLDQGFIGKLIATREGEAVVPDEALVKTVLANTSDTQRFLNSAEEFFPEIDAKGKLKDAYLTGYREQVLTGKTTHAAYIKQIKDTGGLIFTPDELKVLRNAGTARNRVLAVEKKLKQRIKKINSTFNFKVGEKIEPHKLVDRISKSPQDTGRLKKILTPDEWNEYVGARRAKAVKDMTDAKGQMTLTGIDKVLSGSKAELRLTLGGGYVKNLETARKFMQTLARRSAGVTEAKKKVVSALDVTRALIYGPLSHEGFILNIAKGFGRSRSAKALTRMLNDPDLLRERIRIFKLPERQQREQLVNFWGAIGLPMATNRTTDVEELPLEDIE